jgi:antitoxin YefM
MVVTYTQARANLKTLLDEAASSREPIIIQRRHGSDIALIAAEELASLLETVHLLRSPRNAERLLGALSDATRRDRKKLLKSRTLEQLRRDIGIDGKKR